MSNNSTQFYNLTSRIAASLYEQYKEVHSRKLCGKALKLLYPEPSAFVHELNRSTSYRNFLNSIDPVDIEHFDDYFVKITANELTLEVVLGFIEESCELHEIDQKVGNDNFTPDYSEDFRNVNYYENAKSIRPLYSEDSSSGDASMVSETGDIHKPVLSQYTSEHNISYVTNKFYVEVIKEIVLENINNKSKIDFDKNIEKYFLYSFIIRKFQSLLRAKIIKDISSLLNAEIEVITGETKIDMYLENSQEFHEYVKERTAYFTEDYLELFASNIKQESIFSSIVKELRTFVAAIQIPVDSLINYYIVGKYIEDEDRFLSKEIAILSKYKACKIYLDKDYLSKYLRKPALVEQEKRFQLLYEGVANYRINKTTKVSEIYTYNSFKSDLRWSKKIVKILNANSVSNEELMMALEEGRKEFLRREWTELYLNNEYIFEKYYRESQLNIINIKRQIQFEIEKMPNIGDQLLVVLQFSDCENVIDYSELLYEYLKLTQNGFRYGFIENMLGSKRLIQYFQNFEIMIKDPYFCLSIYLDGKLGQGKFLKNNEKFVVQQHPRLKKYREFLEAKKIDVANIGDTNLTQVLLTEIVKKLENYRLGNTEASTLIPKDVIASYLKDTDLSLLGKIDEDFVSKFNNIKSESELEHFAQTDVSRFINNNFIPEALFEAMLAGIPAADVDIFKMSRMHATEINQDFQDLEIHKKNLLEDEYYYFDKLNFELDEVVVNNIQDYFATHFTRSLIPLSSDVRRTILSNQLYYRQKETELLRFCEKVQTNQIYHRQAKSRFVCFKSPYLNEDSDLIRKRYIKSVVSETVEEYAKNINSILAINYYLTGKIEQAQLLSAEEYDYILESPAFLEVMSSYNVKGLTNLG